MDANEKVVFVRFCFLLSPNQYLPKQVKKIEEEKEKERLEKVKKNKYVLYGVVSMRR